MSTREMLDGNEAAARVAHALSEVIAIYPITPASAMGELADAWSEEGKANVWGMVPEVVQMQSEGGAAGAVHGALQTGALSTTFTASQGLLLMIPNMYKIAGELTPTVIHVAARTIATHALSIFGDHSDVMAARQTGFALLASASPQEAHDMAAVAHAATLRSRVPFLHFFDGFRTSHEIAPVETLTSDDLKQLIDEDLVIQHRLRALNPQQPVIRGTAQNPDVFFQAREAANPFYLATAGIVADEMERFAEVTGRRYSLFDYYGASDATRVVVAMGSGVGAAREAVEAAVANGDKMGLVAVRLYRPFDAPAFCAALPSTVESVVVLDRTKEPGAPGEPLYLDVLAALTEHWHGTAPRVTGGRYGLSSKEFTPAMALGVLADTRRPSEHFTVGIVDDVTHTSVAYNPSLWHEPEDVVRAVFYGLGSDGTVGANKNTVKIIGERTGLEAQGYFVYDSKKSGSQTISHLRFSPRPIASTYLIQEPTFIACHQFGMLEQLDLLATTVPGSTLLVNSPYPADEVWHHIPRQVQRTIVERDLELWMIDAGRIAMEEGLGGRVNTVLQAAFFMLNESLLALPDAIDAMREHVALTYTKQGEKVIARNYAAIDRALAALEQVKVPDTAGPPLPTPPSVFEDAPDFVRRVTGMVMAGQGDLLPVSAMPVDGTFPTGTARYEKRALATELPHWTPELCTDCGRCALACPHAAIRLKAYLPDALEGAPETFQWKEALGRDLSGRYLTVQVAPDDCTGCGVCVDVCPTGPDGQKSLDLRDALAERERQRADFGFFQKIPPMGRTEIKLASVKGSQLIDPLFEFSGACSGCGETPYLKLMTQLFGDRVIVANATGCSSIYGANLPTTPWSADDEGRGPAWANSLFEDNGEFGLGMRLALDQKQEEARMLVTALVPDLGRLAVDLLAADQSDRAGIEAQQERVRTLKERLETMEGVLPRRLESMADNLIDTDVWIVGGDGWAYDIGFGGLDHVLASGRNVNILVLDSQVYSNTGGQASKATPRAAVAKFAAGGKRTKKKDLGRIAMGYGNVYVAQLAMGANMAHTVRAFGEAAAHPGVSLIIAYSPCIAHGIDMSTQMTHQKKAAESGFWPLYRFNPARTEDGKNPLQLDSREPTMPFAEFAAEESRFRSLSRVNPEAVDRLLADAQADITKTWQDLTHLAQA